MSALCEWYDLWDNNTYQNFLSGSVKVVQLVKTLLLKVNGNWHGFRYRDACSITEHPDGDKPLGGGSPNVTAADVRMRARIWTGARIAKCFSRSRSTCYWQNVIWQTGSQVVVFQLRVAKVASGWKRKLKFHNWLRLCVELNSGGFLLRVFIPKFSLQPKRCPTVCKTGSRVSGGFESQCDEKFSDFHLIWSPTRFNQLRALLARGAMV